MGDKTGIEWADATWNPMTGCTRVSPGCDHCYIDRSAPFRIAGRSFDGDGPGSGTGVLLHPDRLDQPLRWTRPRKVFVNSLSDLFHEDVPDDYIIRVFAVMALAQRHTFQLLTKRHGRMKSLLGNKKFREGPSGWLSFEDCVKNVAFNERNNLLTGSKRPKSSLPNPDHLAYPFPNVWIGVTVENQQWANMRIPALLDTPAAVRFLSVEPMVGPVDLDLALSQHTLGLKLDDCLDCCNEIDLHDQGGYNIGEHECSAHTNGIRPIDWVIVGGESGPQARPMHPDWARKVVDDCRVGDVPVIFKQWGEWAPHKNDGGIHTNPRLSQARNQYESVRFRPTGEHYTGNDVGNAETGYSAPGMTSMLRVGKKKAGRELDGATHDGYPSIPDEPTAGGDS